MDLEERVLAIVGRSRGGLTVEAVSEAYAKDMQKDIQETLDRLSQEGQVNRNRGANGQPTTYHRAVIHRRGQSPGSE
ncbi:hypothetical protein [Ancylobacter amanitiformis]|uniref:Flp pilus assembly protein TadB n=1 Tax=Ancylobacter amanitiformis TaxID=217069 RepID=A0ABU0LP80_9HYPH|nr:hypothetical protein [Ancylobacter amanitiformis]MDQ0510479.1 Flp pilus assembly protein TadB [Ancylobacter amanitiformis]